MGSGRPLWGLVGPILGLSVLGVLVQGGPLLGLSGPIWGLCGLIWSVSGA